MVLRTRIRGALPFTVRSGKLRYLTNVLNAYDRGGGGGGEGGGGGLKETELIVAYYCFFHQYFCGKYQTYINSLDVFLSPPPPPPPSPPFSFSSICDALCLVVVRLNNNNKLHTDIITKHAEKIQLVNTLLGINLIKCFVLM